jgi:F0F1-type ATP synthase membrane subunit a
MSVSYICYNIWILTILTSLVVILSGYSYIIAKGIFSYTMTYSLLQFNIGNILYGLLECISVVFRIGSLCFRLFGNLLAGHIILHLLFALFIITSLSSALILVLAIYSILFILELVLSCVQIYVFLTLTSIYYLRWFLPYYLFLQDWRLGGW